MNEASAQRPGPRNRILVVDDEAGIANLVAQILRDGGYDAWVETDARNVPTRAAALHPNLLILDFHMPKLLGSELAVLLKSDPATSAIPVIFLSGMADGDHRTIATMSGGVAYLGKPVNEGMLLDTVQTLLGRP